MCKTCQIGLPKGGSFCRSTIVKTCKGCEPVAGCGARLTPTERHQFGTFCENCEREWHFRLQKWRRGNKDETLTMIFGKAETSVF